MKTSLLVLCCFFSFVSASWGQNNVLFLGDSLSADKTAGLGRNLELPKDQFRLRVVAFCGFSPDNYTSASAQGKMSSPCGAYLRKENGKFIANEDGGPLPLIVLPTLAHLMHFQHGSKKADLVVIQLGTNLFDNLLNGQNDTREIRRQCEDLISTVFRLNPDAKVLWLAPPKIVSYGDPPNASPVSTSASEEMFHAIREAMDTFNKGHKTRVILIDSRDYTAYPPAGDDGDGTHFDELQVKWLEKTKLMIEKLAMESTAA